MVGGVWFVGWEGGVVGGGLVGGGEWWKCGEGDLLVGGELYLCCI